MQEERKKVDNRVKETKRRTIQDVVSRVILDGDEQVTASIDADALLADPNAVITGKKTVVKEMAVKFKSGTGGSTSAFAASAGGSSAGGAAANGGDAGEEMSGKMDDSNL